MGKRYELVSVMELSTTRYYGPAFPIGTVCIMTALRLKNFGVKQELFGLVNRKKKPRKNSLWMSMYYFI